MYATQLSQLGIDLNHSWSGQIKALCPRCSDTRKHKSDRCLSVNIDEGYYNCKNCGWKGAVSDKVYAIPEKRPALTRTECESIYTWFAARGLGADTVDHFNLSHSIEKFPEIINGKEEWVQKRVTCYNYYSDGRLINIKFKTRDKQFRMVKDAQKIPYNIDSVSDQGYVIIVEGEEEAMVWHQCGYSSVISCPNGASKGVNNLDWLDVVYNKLAGKKIYIANDNDEPGIKLRDDLTRRFDINDVYYIDYSLKDGNDTLKEYGKDALVLLYENARQAPHKEIAEAKDYFEVVQFYLKNGYPKGPSLQLPLTDEHWSFNRGQLMVKSGIPNHGKTTMLDWQLNRLAFLHGWKTAFFTPEHAGPLKIARWCEQYVGKALHKMNERELRDAMHYVDRHIVFYNTNEITDFSMDHLLEVGVSMIKRYGVDSIVFDPYTYIENREEGDNNTDRIGRMLVRLHNFAVRYDVLIILVAHPRKMDKKGGSDSENYVVPRLYDISGSNNFFNTSDMGAVTYRDYSTNITTEYFQKIKQHFHGKIGSVDYEFDPETGLYCEVGSKILAISKEYREENEMILL